MCGPGPPDAARIWPHKYSSLVTGPLAVISMMTSTSSSQSCHAINSVCVRAAAIPALVHKHCRTLSEVPHPLRKLW